jgi:hypothetical protein
MLSYVLAAALLAAQPGVKQEELNLKLEVPVLLTELAAAYLVSTIFHESVHVLTAKAIGAPMLHTTVYPTTECGGLQPGCIVMDGSGTTYTQHLYASAAGSISTRYTADFIDYVADKDFTGRRTDQALAAMYFMFRSDIALYVVNDAIHNWRGDPQDEQGNDIQSVVRYATSDSDRQKWIFAGLVAVVVLDIIVDWDSFKNNWDRLWLRPVKRNE